MGVGHTSEHGLGCVAGRIAGRMVVYQVGVWASAKDGGSAYEGLLVLGGNSFRCQLHSSH